jgi:multicomponent Na+:H+ antiporter subunit B
MDDFFALPFKSEFYINEIALLISAIIMIISCLKLIISNNLVQSIIIMSVFSLFIGLCYLFMDAPDVAMTEAALGSCLSTCVLLNLVKIVGEDVGKARKSRIIFAAILCCVLVSVLSLATLDIATFGSENSPIQTHLTKYYIENTYKDIGIPSMVAAILASYRGYDTLGETAVILIAGLAVVVIISRKKEKNA